MIFLGLGSNLGAGKTREENLIAAVKLLNAYEAIQVTKISSLYETEPVGFLEQPDFLNCVLRVDTTLAPLFLLNAILDVEENMGRTRDTRWGPRNIDIDLLIYNDVVMDTEELKLPHPLMRERKFVLAPLAEIAGDLPVCKNMTAREMLLASKDKSSLRKYPSKIWEEAFELG